MWRESAGRRDVDTLTQENGELVGDRPERQQTAGAHVEVDKAIAESRRAPVGIAWDGGPLLALLSTRDSDQVRSGCAGWAQRS